MWLEGKTPTKFCFKSSSISFYSRHIFYKPIPQCNVLVPSLTISDIISDWAIFLKCLFFIFLLPLLNREGMEFIPFDINFLVISCAKGLFATDLAISLIPLPFCPLFSTQSGSFLFLPLEARDLGFSTTCNN